MVQHTKDRIEVSIIIISLGRFLTCPFEPSSLVVIHLTSKMEFGSPTGMAAIYLLQNPDCYKHL